MSMKRILLLCTLLSSSLGRSASNDAVRVTAVEGESWLNHIHRTFDESSMGKTGHLGPPAPMPGEDSSDWRLGAWSGFTAQTITLSGRDIYRLNCQGCHTESGQGAPPEINSVINPVRSTSVAVIMDQMKQRGMEMSHSDAATLARQSNEALLQRLHHGGQDMPSFSHLSDAEIRSLMAYLRQLAGVPGAEKEQITITEGPSRVGEYVVKSTCHICHAAAGPNPDPEQISEGTIPPLSTLTTRTSLPQFVRKVTVGAPIAMGTPPLPCRGRMPVFYYLSQNEAADAYLYLTLYPSHN